MAEAYHQRLLYESAKNGKLAGLEVSLRNGVSVESGLGSFRGTALHVASGHGHFAIDKMLLDAGANIDSRD